MTESCPSTNASSNANTRNTWGSDQFIDEKVSDGGSTVIVDGPEQVMLTEGQSRSESQPTLGDDTIPPGATQLPVNHTGNTVTLAFLARVDEAEPEKGCDESETRTATPVLGEASSNVIAETLTAIEAIGPPVMRTVIGIGPASNGARADATNAYGMADEFGGCAIEFDTAVTLNTAAAFEKAGIVMLVGEMVNKPLGSADAVIVTGSVA
jgi:hypothetical protein